MFNIKKKFRSTSVSELPIFLPTFFSSLYKQPSFVPTHPRWCHFVDWSRLCLTSVTVLKNKNHFFGKYFQLFVLLKLPKKPLKLFLCTRFRLLPFHNCVSYCLVVCVGVQERHTHVFLYFCLSHTRFVVSIWLIVSLLATFCLFSQLDCCRNFSPPLYCHFDCFRPNFFSPPASVQVKKLFSKKSFTFFVPRALRQCLKSVFVRFSSSSSSFLLLESLITFPTHPAAALTVPSVQTLFPAAFLRLPFVKQRSFSWSFGRFSFFFSSPACFLVVFSFIDFKRTLFLHLFGRNFIAPCSVSFHFMALVSAKSNSIVFLFLLIR